MAFVDFEFLTVHSSHHIQTSVCKKIHFHKKHAFLYWVLHNEWKEVQHSDHSFSMSRQYSVATNKAPNNIIFVLLMFLSWMSSRKTMYIPNLCLMLMNLCNGHNCVWQRHLVQTLRRNTAAFFYFCSQPSPTPKKNTKVSFFVRKTLT